jgi:predicted nucleic acid-binding protein
VNNELCQAQAPSSLRAWALARPSWLLITSAPIIIDPETASLDSGERAAIALAEFLPADLILMDERKGVRVSLQKGFEVAGTLGILNLAARHRLINLAESFDRLKATNFRYRPQMLEDLVARFRSGR